jgi:iron complex outermembrane recepter protein
MTMRCLWTCLSTDRIEVLRGPAALLYGGSAVGGVVNVIDNRIPRAPVSGVLGKAQLQAGTGNDERSVAGLVELGNERYALHLDGFDRRTGDVRVPVSLALHPTGSPANARRICNSASTARGGAFGASTFWDHGYLGASVNTYQSDYGTVAEDEVTIGMKTTRYALEGQLRQLPGWFESVKARLSHTDYRHTEFFNGGPETVFSNKGQDLRIEARHRALAGWQGVLGVQTESSRFSAVGDEAFAPFSRTRSQALFVHEELPTAWGQVTTGARWESVRVESLGNPELDRFDEGIGAKKFTPFSVAAGAVFKLSPTWSLTGNAALTQRAPKDYELFANGPHLATNAWEIGQQRPGLGKVQEPSMGFGVEVGPEPHGVTAFASQFANYIGLMNTPGRYGGRFAGANLPRRQSPIQGLGSQRPSAPVAGRFDTRSGLACRHRAGHQQQHGRAFAAHLAHACGCDAGPWPRPLECQAGRRLACRAKACARWQRGHRAYTLVNASVSYRQKLDATVLNWFARLDNLTDQLAYSASSILTSTAFGKSPLPGRSFKLGVQATSDGLRGVA